ncbi:6405_t:CDS:2 [Ambispora gerdemannii]|uniref:6405_t:CDS:1 n=1 Tax=Ambispora gerdemannii TaxID=144530 RepID=A0A9N9AM34_9GLOM|nr:6405_t:CDS:2 [Ambispora gerdemannii]
MTNSNSTVDNSALRQLIFINSSYRNRHLMVRHNDAKPIFKPPFPPKFEAEDTTGKRQSGANPSKPPNAFILYRRAFVKAAIAEGYQLPMTVISTMASQSWEQELPFNIDNSNGVFKNLVNIEQFTMAMPESEDSFNFPKIPEVSFEADTDFNLISNELLPESNPSIVELIENMPTINNKFTEVIDVLNSQFCFNNNSFESFEHFIFDESIDTASTFQPAQEPTILDQDSFLLEQQDPLIFETELEHLLSFSDEE